VSDSDSEASVDDRAERKRISFSVESKQNKVVAESDVEQA